MASVQPKCFLKLLLVLVYFAKCEATLIFDGGICVLKLLGNSAYCMCYIFYRRSKCFSKTSTSDYATDLK